MTFKKKSFDLSGKVAVVIGGTRGIGRGISLTLADHGADVIPASRNIENAKSVVAEIEAIGRKSMLVSMDCSSQEQLIKLKDDILKEFGHIDILVNSQGVERRGYIKDFSLEDWRTVLSVNIDSVFLATKIFGNVMIQQGAGKIINIASMASFLGLIEAPAYTASKGAVLQFTKASALEFAPYNIQVNGIAPGWFKTELTQPVQDNKELYEMIKNKIPAGEWGDVEELGACAVFLSSNASDYVTGATIPVDGGFLYNGA
ncbi:SDR family oxidoreductase [Sinanaerobacter chloroacetimidivorans]|uniref:SDR family oxidoreductase n=1 Tax=Sinanaerobacter chloroacetimidivorans TaxID=2818044 RepID=A0A8J7VZ76_9FIRM|nr:SDR family oxidoreductase [Sinanaerobacter chloroacetimidivorans]MBR0597857.1 SDR family oxidoreductase [Sinanaerobacter chloroacetimidivorans]